MGSREHETNIFLAKKKKIRISLSKFWSGWPRRFNNYQDQIWLTVVYMWASLNPWHQRKAYPGCISSARQRLLKTCTSEPFLDHQLLDHPFGIRTRNTWRQTSTNIKLWCNLNSASSLDFCHDRPHAFLFAGASNCTRCPPGSYQTSRGVFIS